MDPKRRNESLVARMAPAESDVPVFASYDLRRQFDTLRLVEQLTTVPVPKMWWMESDPTALGSQFFVMSRVDGDVPPDVMPYTFGDNWLFDAPASRSRRAAGRVGVGAGRAACDRAARRGLRVT